MFSRNYYRLKSSENATKQSQVVKFGDLNGPRYVTKPTNHFSRKNVIHIVHWHSSRVRSGAFLLKIGPTVEAINILEDNDENII